MDTNPNNWTTTWLIMGTLTDPRPQLKVDARPIRFDHGLLGHGAHG